MKSEVIQENSLPLYPHPSAPHLFTLCTA